MGITTGILLFDDAEELDFAGPWEVFTMAARKEQGDRVVTIAPKPGTVRCAKGLRVLPTTASRTRPSWTWCWCPEARARAGRSTTPS